MEMPYTYTNIGYVKKQLKGKCPKLYKARIRTYRCGYYEYSLFDYAENEEKVLDLINADPIYANDCDASLLYITVVNLEQCINKIL